MAALDKATSVQYNDFVLYFFFSFLPIQSWLLKSNANGMVEILRRLNGNSGGKHCLSSGVFLIWCSLQSYLLCFLWWQERKKGKTKWRKMLRVVSNRLGTRVPWNVKWMSFAYSIFKMGALQNFVGSIIEIIEHKTCKSGKRKLSQQQYLWETYRLIAVE